MFKKGSRHYHKDITDMTNVLLHKGKEFFYKYDEYQDALFLTFVEKPALSYYEELENGVMVRKDADTDAVIGYTVRNISAKILESFLSDKMVNSIM